MWRRLPWAVIPQWSDSLRRPEARKGLLHSWPRRAHPSFQGHLCFLWCISASGPWHLPFPTGKLPQVGKGSATRSSEFLLKCPPLSEIPEPPSLKLQIPPPETPGPRSILQEPYPFICGSASHGFSYLQTTGVQKYEMQNPRNKQFLRFKGLNVTCLLDTQGRY